MYTRGSALLSKEINRIVTDKNATLGTFFKPTFSEYVQKLFKGAEGFFYDPNDLSTMFQDDAGTVSVTAVRQPVGLMLDESKGLVRNAEIIINGDFSNGKTGWLDISGWWSVVSGRAYHPLSSAYNELSQSLESVAGKFVEVTFDIEVLQGIVNIGVTAANISHRRIGVGTHSVKFYALASATSKFFAARGSGKDAECYIDNVSVKVIAGNHTYQTTSAARPILQDTPRRIDFDAVDDKLITNLPAQLTGCTVIRSVPNVGTQILTGQTIPATYEDTTDHCGLLVINRALTPSETSTITAEFNKRAGV